MKDAIEHPSDVVSKLFMNRLKDSINYNVILSTNQDPETKKIISILSNVITCSILAPYLSHTFQSLLPSPLKPHKNTY